MANENAAWIRVHDLSFVPHLRKAFEQHTGYKSGGGALDAFWFQYGEIRCAKHPDFAANKSELQAIVELAKKMI